MLTIEPCCLAASMRRAASCALANTASRLTPSTLRHSSADTSMARRGDCAMPALLTRMVTVPKTFSAAPKARAMAAASVTSPSIASFKAASRSVRRATSATDAPLSASALANWMPSPLEAPVTSATRPFKENISAAFMGNSYTVACEFGQGDDVKRLWRATLNSWNGLVAAAQSEQAFREELVVLAIGVPLAFFLTADAGRRIALIGTLVVILIVELLNTAIEKLSDHISRDHVLVLKRVKEMGSAAIFLTLLPAGMMWLWIAVERLWPA